MYDFIYYGIKNAKTYFNMTFLFLTFTTMVLSITFFHTLVQNLDIRIKKVILARSNQTIIAAN